MNLNDQQRFRIDRVYRKSSGNPRYVGYCPGGYEYEVVDLLDDRVCRTFARKRDARAFVKSKNFNVHIAPIYVPADSEEAS